MGRQSADRQVYPFAWLDETVEITLNPDRGIVYQLQTEELGRLQEKLDVEIWQVYSQLKTEIFYILSPKKLGAIVRKYQNELLLLRQQARANLEKYPEFNTLRKTGKMVIETLSGLSMSIEERFPGFLQEAGNPQENTTIQPEAHLFKILCTLSVDQIGIILRAADDSKLILSKSLSLIFKLIVPYLSTQNKNDLSWDSMRSNSYHPEGRDKEVAIEALEKMVEKIMEY